VFFVARGLGRAISCLSVLPVDGERDQVPQERPRATPSAFPCSHPISMAASNKYLARRNRSCMRVEATKQRDASGKVHERQQEPRLSALSCRPSSNNAETEPCMK
jgi:hypothetical protein